jgi:hypothetical protein
MARTNVFASAKLKACIVGALFKRRVGEHKIDSGTRKRLGFDDYSIILDHRPRRITVRIVLFFSSSRSSASSRAARATRRHAKGAGCHPILKVVLEGGARTWCCLKILDLLMFYQNGTCAGRVTRLFSERTRRVGADSTTPFIYCGRRQPTFNEWSWGSSPLFFSGSLECFGKWGSAESAALREKYALKCSFLSCYILIHFLPSLYSWNQISTPALFLHPTHHPPAGRACV